MSSSDLYEGVIRELNAQDLGEVCELLPTQDSENLNSHIDKAWIIDEISQGEGLGLFCKNLELKAFLFYRILGGPKDKRSVKEFEITFLQTSKDHRQKNIMSELFNYFEVEVVKDGKILLEVHEKNMAAKSFYLKQGLELIYQRKNYYRDGGAAEVMVK